MQTTAQISLTRRQALSRGLVITAALCTMLATRHSAHAQGVADQIEDRDSIVYFLGSVLRVDPGFAVVDLGTAQTLKEGDQLAVFRPTNGYFAPRGVITVREAFLTWVLTDRPAHVDPQPEDLIVVVRELRELSTADRHRRDVLADNLLTSRSRNGYSTRGNVVKADALSRFQRAADKWVYSDRYIAAEIHAPSIGGKTSTRMRRLLNQINLLRNYQRQGLAAVLSGGDQWISVMNTLTGSMAREEGAARREQVVVESPDQAEPLTPADIRALIQDIFFARSEEEQAFLGMIIARILERSERDERLTLRLEIRDSQFPSMITEEQLLLDIERALRTLRQRQRDAGRS